VRRDAFVECNGGKNLSKSFLCFDSFRNFLIFVKILIVLKQFCPLPTTDRSFKDVTLSIIVSHCKQPHRIICM